MSPSWQRLGAIAAGGTVFHVQEEKGCVWLGTRAGAFRSSQERWDPQPVGASLPYLSALHAAPGLLLGGGMGGELLYSTDEGATWYEGRAPQVHDTLVSCFAVSPRLRDSGVVLAGTDGAGILRSTNRGKDWQLANFGLQELHIVALATAPGRLQLGVPYERVGRWIAFAATPKGLYRSPNGGRAWQPVNLGPARCSIQALAVSPTFAEDGVVFAGSEAHGVFRSSDRGRTWSSVDLELDYPVAINSLWLHPAFARTPVCVVGAADGRLLRSDDGGATWKTVHTSDVSVLALGGASVVYAGLYEKGLLASDDEGRRWVSMPLHAWPFVRLRSSNGSLLAWGAQVSPRQTEDGAQTWRVLELPGDQHPLTATSANGWVIGSDAGILRETSEGQWMLHLPDRRVTALATTPEGLLAGSHRGEIYRSKSGAERWERLATPDPPSSIMALAANGPLTVAVTPGPKEELLIWCWDAVSRAWERWHEARSTFTSAHLLVRGECVWAALGRTLWRGDKDGWETILETERPILRLEEDIGKDVGYVLTSHTIWSTSDETTFTALAGPPEAGILVDLAIATRSRRLYVLEMGGELWCRQL